MLENVQRWACGRPTPSELATISDAPDEAGLMDLDPGAPATVQHRAMNQLTSTRLAASQATATWCETRMLRLLLSSCQSIGQNYCENPAF